MIGIPAIYRDGVFHPLQPVQLPEQSNVVVMLPQANTETENSTKDEQAFLRTAGAWANVEGVDDVLQQLEEMRQSATFRDEPS